MSDDWFAGFKAGRKFEQVSRDYDQAVEKVGKSLKRWSWGNVILSVLWLLVAIAYGLRALGVG